FGVCAWILEPFDAFDQPRVVVGDGEKRRPVVGIGLVVGRHVIAAIRRGACEPLVELPGIEQRGLAVEELLNLFARHARGVASVAHPARSISSLQRRQKTRMWPSSVLSCASAGLAMPRDMSDQPTSRHAARPCWTASSAATSSGVAKPPGPEGKEGIEPPRPLCRRLFGWAEAPGRDVHAIGRDRKEGAYGYRRAVVEREIGKNDEVAVGIGDARGAFLAQARDQLAADRLDVGFGVFAVDRNPAGHRAAAEIDVVGGEMAVAEILTPAFRW